LKLQSSSARLRSPAGGLRCPPAALVESSRRTPAGAGSPGRPASELHLVRCPRSPPARIGAGPRRTGRLDLTRAGAQARRTESSTASGSHRPKQSLVVQEEAEPARLCACLPANCCAQKVGRRCFKLQFPLSTACLPSLRATTTIPIFSLSPLFA
jgi:hypothetical protein